MSYQAHPEFTNTFSKELLNVRQDQLRQNICKKADQKFESLVPSAHIADQIVQIFRDRIMVTAYRN